MHRCEEAPDPGAKVLVLCHEDKSVYTYTPDFINEALSLYGDNEQLRDLLQAGSIQVGHHFSAGPLAEIQASEVVEAFNTDDFAVTSALVIRAIDLARRDALRDAWKKQVTVWIPSLAETTFFDPIIPQQTASQ